MCAGGSQAGLKRNHKRLGSFLHDRKPAVFFSPPHQRAKEELMLRRTLALLALATVWTASHSFSEEAKKPDPPTTEPLKTAPSDGEPKKVKPKLGEKPVEIVEIVVSATKLPTPREATGTSITTISARDLEINQDTHAAEALRMVPGVVINQSGRRGDFTQIRVRGGETDHTAVLWDGFKVNSTGQGRQYAFDALDPVGVQQMEVARGAGSVLHGSDAVTGAVSLITKKGEGKPKLTTSAAGGTFGTDRETLQIEGSHNWLAYNVSASRINRRGAEVRNSEFTALNWAARLDFELHKDHALKLLLRQAEIEKGFYTSNPSGYGTKIEDADPNDDLRKVDFLAGLEYVGRPVPIWETILRPGFFETETTSITKLPNPDSLLSFQLDPFGFSGPYQNQPSRSWTRDQRVSIEWRNNVTAFENKHIKDIVTLGYYAEKESFSERFAGKEVSFPPPFFSPVINFNRRTNYFDSHNQAYFVQNRLELFKRAFLTAGWRREDHGLFGKQDIFRGEGSILIPESNTRLFGSAGTSFRAPSFSELFGRFGGNPALLPEKNMAFDVGIEQHFWKRRIMLSATYFDNQFTNLIINTFNPAKQEFTFDNLGRATSHGWEFQARFKPVKQLTLEGTATSMRAIDEVIFRRLARRPEHTFTGRLTAHPLVDLVKDEWDGLDLSLEYLSVSNRRDIAPLAPVRQIAAFDFTTAFGGPTAIVGNARIGVLKHKVKGYQRFDLAVSYRFWQDRLRAFVRAENFTNKQYEDVATFPGDGANFLGGLEFSWGF